MKIYKHGAIAHDIKGAVMALIVQYSPTREFIFDKLSEMTINTDLISNFLYDLYRNDFIIIKDNRYYSTDKLKNYAEPYKVK